MPKSLQMHVMRYDISELPTDEHVWRMCGSASVGLAYRWNCVGQGLEQWLVKLYQDKDKQIARMREVTLEAQGTPANMMYGDDMCL
jgi:hypothetical protein